MILVESAEPEGRNNHTRLQFPERSIADLRDVAIEQQQYGDKCININGENIKSAREEPDGEEHQQPRRLVR